MGNSLRWLVLYAFPIVVDENSEFDQAYPDMTFTLTDNITLYRTQTLTDWNDAETRLIFNPP